MTHKDIYSQTQQYLTRARIVRVMYDSEVLKKFKA